MERTHLESLSVVDQLTALAASCEEYLSMCNASAAAENENLEIPRERLSIMSWSKPGEALETALAVMTTAANSISSGATKFTLLYKTSPPPTPHISAGMVTEIDKYAAHLSSSLTVASSHAHGASPFLLNFLYSAVIRILKCLIDLVKTVIDEVKSNLESNLESEASKATPILTGIVWEACNAFTSLPSNNKIACRLKLMRWGLAVKDTIDEFQAVVDAESADPNQISVSLDGMSLNTHTHASNNTDAGDDFQDLEDFMGGLGEDNEGGMSQEEIESVGAAVQLLSAVRPLFKAANDVLATLQDSTNSNSTHTEDVPMIWAGSVCYILQIVSEHASELGMALYAPIDSTVYMECVSQLDQSVSAFLSKYRESTKEGVAEEALRLYSLLRSAVERAQIAGRAL